MYHLRCKAPRKHEPTARKEAEVNIAMPPSSVLAAHYLFSKEDEDVKMIFS